MRRGLYVLFEGLPETVIDSQVLAHVREMRAAGIVDFDVWAFGWGELHRRSVARLAEAERSSGGVVRLLPCVRPAAPFSTLRNALRLGVEIAKRRGNFDVIHARTDYAAAACGRARTLASAELIWDCRGDTAAEIAARRVGSPAMVRIGRLIARRRIARAARACTKAIFVSEALASTVGFRGKPFEIIPCTASAETFFFDSDLRGKTRNLLGYADDDRVLVYSGSLEFYQCFAESVALFGRAQEADRSLRLLVLTPEVEKATKQLRPLPQGSFRVLHAPLARVNDYLNAADFALMLRRESPVNRVASPTKFAEYCLAGLPVIMTEAVLQAHELAGRFGNRILHRFGEAPEPLRTADFEERRRIAAAARPVLSRAATRESFARLYGEPGATL